jgi:AraC-like DNA-binding protein
MRIEKNDAMLETVNGVSLRVLSAGHALSGREWVGNISSPPYARLYYIMGGDPFSAAAGETIPMKTGFCYLFPTGYSFVHGCGSAMEQLYFHVCLSDSYGRDLLRECRGRMEMPCSAERMQRLLGLLKSETLCDHLALRQEITADLLTLFARYGVSPEEKECSPCVGKAIRLIHERLSVQLTTAELAEDAAVSESTLSKRFRAETGQSLRQYLDGEVLFAAEQLLLKSTLSVREVSERFGFCDQFYFSRRFRQKFGDTPQHYRKTHIV